jgi:hypothetical protein
VLVGLLAAPASASAGTKSKSATTAGNLAIASATAKCPTGQRATGGGFTASPPLNSTTFFMVYESRKVGQRSWRASGQISDTGASGAAFTLTAFAYCSKSAPSTKSKSASVASTPVNAFFAADAKCSSGKAQAGGFIGTPPGAAITSLVTDSFRVDKKTWRSRMQSGGAAGLTFTSYVYCADETKPAARSGSTTSATPGGAPATALSGECKRGTKPVAGGFSQPNAVTGAPFTGRFQLFYASLKSGKRWLVSAQHYGDQSTTLNSIAYCA